MRDLYTNLIAYVRSLVGNKVGINENAHEDTGDVYTPVGSVEGEAKSLFAGDCEPSIYYFLLFDACIKQPTGNECMYSMQVCLSVEQTHVMALVSTSNNIHV